MPPYYVYLRSLWVSLGIIQGPSGHLCKGMWRCCRVQPSFDWFVQTYFSDEVCTGAGLVTKLRQSIYMKNLSLPRHHMSVMAFLIIGNSIVCPKVRSGYQQFVQVIHKGNAKVSNYWHFIRRINLWPVDLLHNGHSMPREHYHIITVLRISQSIYRFHVLFDPWSYSREQLDSKMTYTYVCKIYHYAIIGNVPVSIVYCSHQIAVWLPLQYLAISCVNY